MLHNRQLTVLVYAPQSPEGKIITREPQCLRECRTPYPAFHNIIPSELCNSRRHRQCPASREEVSRGQKPAKTAYRASDYTIRIMLSVSVGAVRRSYLRISRARRRRTGSPPQGPPASRPVGGLRTLRSFVSAASRFQPRSGSRLFAQALETTVSAPFSDRVSVVCVGAKCRPAYRQCYATVITRWEPPCSASSPPP